MLGTILVVDDDVVLTKTLEKILKDAQYTPLVAYTAEDGVRLAMSQPIDLILLDVMVPTMGGWEACRQIRLFSNQPIVFLTALGNVENVVYGLEMGADDYLVKPVDHAEFLARIYAHLRRMKKTSPALGRLEFGHGELIIDLATHLVVVQGKEVELTPREFDMLAVLVANAGRVITTSELVKQAWNMHDKGALDNAKPYIHYLRKKIEVDPAEPRWILTVRGIGYRFVDE